MTTGRQVQAVDERERMPARDLHEANRASWNAATAAHNSHKGDQARYLREGGCTLFPDELALLGDLAGRRLVHLQCNAGQDTLSLARRGASVLGVDISDEAVGFARQLSQESGIPADFVRSDLYDWLDSTDERFDVAFSSYGALCWLSDLGAWARGVARILRPGGRLVLMEFHPFFGMLDEEWRLRYPYSSQGEPWRWDDGVSDYVALSGEALSPWGFEPGVQDFRNPHPAHEFFWGLGEVVTAVAASGLRVETLVERPWSNGYRPFAGMRDLGGRRFGPPEGLPTLPLMFGLVAQLP